MLIFKEKNRGERMIFESGKSAWRCLYCHVHQRRPSPFLKDTKKINFPEDKTISKAIFFEIQSPRMQ